jgi:hypothetical protein
MVPMAIDAVAPPFIIAGILGVWFWVALFRWLGSRISAFAKFDDVVRLILTVLGISGALLAIPILVFLGQAIQWFFVNLSEYFLDGRIAGDVVSVLVAIVLGVVGVMIYLSRGTFKNLMWMTVLLAPLFGLDVVRQITDPFLEFVGVNTWNALCKTFSVLQKLDVRFEG